MTTLHPPTLTATPPDDIRYTYLDRISDRKLDELLHTTLASLVGIGDYYHAELQERLRHLYLEDLRRMERDRFLCYVQAYCFGDGGSARCYLRDLLLIAKRAHSIMDPGTIDWPHDPSSPFGPDLLPPFTGDLPCPKAVTLKLVTCDDS